ncbi:MAG: hypothetical protein NVSMB1_24190 [Polyangiales bacterium]
MNDLHDVGCAVTLEFIAPSGMDSFTIVVRGIAPLSLRALRQHDPFLVAEVEVLAEAPNEPPPDVVSQLVRQGRELAARSMLVGETRRALESSLDDPPQLAAAVLNFAVSSVQQHALAASGATARMLAACEELQRIQAAFEPRLPLAETLPVFPMRQGAVLPSHRTYLRVGSASSLRLFEDLSAVGEGFIIVAVRRDPSLENPRLADLQPTATLVHFSDIKLFEPGRAHWGMVPQRIDFSDSTIVPRKLGRRRRFKRDIEVFAYGCARVRLLSLVQEEPYPGARFEALRDRAPWPSEEDVIRLRECVRSPLFSSDTEPALEFPEFITNAGAFADAVLHWVSNYVNPSEFYDVLDTFEAGPRVRKVISLVERVQNELAAQGT